MHRPSTRRLLAVLTVPVAAGVLGAAIVGGANAEEGSPDDLPAHALPLTDDVGLIEPATEVASGGERPFANCDDARASGEAPLRRGDAGYRAGLDSDGDGIACQ